MVITRMWLRIYSFAWLSTTVPCFKALELWSLYMIAGMAWYVFNLRSTLLRESFIWYIQARYLDPLSHAQYLQDFHIDIGIHRGPKAGLNIGGQHPRPDEVTLDREQARIETAISFSAFEEKKGRQIECIVAILNWSDTESPFDRVIVFERDLGLHMSKRGDIDEKNWARESRWVHWEKKWYHGVELLLICGRQSSDILQTRYIQVAA